MRLNAPMTRCKSDLYLFGNQPDRTYKHEARVPIISVENSDSHHTGEVVCKANYVTPVMF